jgi:Fe-S oxidoreductase
MQDNKNSGNLEKKNSSEVESKRLAQLEWERTGVGYILQAEGDFNEAEINNISSSMRNSGASVYTFRPKGEYEGKFRVGQLSFLIPVNGESVERFGRVLRKEGYEFLIPLPLIPEDASKISFLEIADKDFPKTGIATDSDRRSAVEQYQFFAARDQD